MIEVEVVRHFNEDAFSIGLAEGMADRLREALRDVRCFDHDEELSVRVSTDGIAETVNELHVDVSGCCEAVVDRVRDIVEVIRGCAPPGGSR